MFLVNSRQANFRCARACAKQTREAISRSYGRLFAEFLGELSPVRLGLLDHPTCVGLRYGRYFIKLRGFSRKALHASRFAVAKLPDKARFLRIPDFPKMQSSPSRRQSNKSLALISSVTPSHKVAVTEY